MLFKTRQDLRPNIDSHTILYYNSEVKQAAYSSSGDNKRVLSAIEKRSRLNPLRIHPSACMYS